MEDAEGSFSPAQHEPWFGEFAALPWRRIWTLNVDDTVENSLAGGDGLGRPFESLSWDDPYIESGDLQVIHLHGHVRGKDCRKLVFSFSEYQKAATEQPVWHKVLTGLLVTEPFVIVGATLLNDPDVEQALMAHRPNSVAPSIVVDPNIDDANAWELGKLGYQVVKLTGEEFSLEWRSITGLARNDILELREQTGLSVPQFTRLSLDRYPPPPGGHDFYAGDQPQWADLANDREALMRWVHEETRRLAHWLKGPRMPALRILYGARLSGLSTGLLSLGKRAIYQDFRVFNFDRSSTWEPGLVADLARNGPTILLVEAAADFGDVIDKTMRLAHERSLPLMIICMDVYRNDLRLEGRLLGPYEKTSKRLSPRLGGADARAVVGALGDAGRLGRLEPLSPHERVGAVKGRDIFSAMIDIEQGAGFQKRLAGEVGHVPNGWHVSLLVLLGFAAKTNRPVSIGDAALALGVSSESVVNAVQEDHLNALTEIVEGALYARQRDRALDVLIARTGKAAALDRLSDILTNLAPANSRAALRERNRIPLLVGGLMTFSVLRDQFSNEELDRFYDGLRPIFGGWNGRYWEQRAKLAKVSGDWAKAESFAGRAVTLYDDPFTRTTYGTILINRAAVSVKAGDPAWTDFYRRGGEQFDRAQESGQGGRITYFAYLTATISLLEDAEATGHSREFLEEIRAVRKEWEDVYVQLRLSLRDDTELSSQERISTLYGKWEALALS